jgi:hypothetical protein
MSDIERCPECGSWSEQCASDEPVPGCRCRRCACAHITDLERQVQAYADRISELESREGIDGLIYLA